MNEDLIKYNVKYFQNRFESILCVNGHVNIFFVKEAHIDFFLKKCHRQYNLLSRESTIYQ